MDGKGSEMEDLMKTLSDLEVERDYYRQVAERLGRKALADAQDFSQMIRDLRKREIKLQQSQEELEKTIQQRTVELITRNKELSESTLRYDTLVKRIPHGVYVLRVRDTGEMQFEYLSPPLCQILAIDPAEVQQNASLAFSIAHPDDREELERTTRETTKHRIPFRWEGRFIIRQEVRWIRIEADSKPTPNGDIVWNGVLSDITEQRLIQDKLKESEERLKFIVKNSSDILVIINADKSIKYLSPAAEKITGFPTAELQGKAFDMFIHPDDIETVTEAWAEAVKHPKKTVTVVYRHIHKTPGWVLLEFIAQSFLAEPAIKGVIASVRDITEHKRVERFLRDVIKKNPMSIQILNKDGLTLEVNNSYKTLFGSAPPPDYSIFSDPQLLQMGMGKLFDQLRDGANVRFPDTYFNAHDSIPEFPDIPSWIRTLGFPVNDSQGKPERFVLMHENITERKQAEQMQRESEEHLSSIFRSAPVGIGSVVNRELRRVNSRLCEMTGYDEGELVGQSARILYHSNEDFEFVGREKYAQIRDHGTGTVETHWQRKDGTTIEVLLSSTPVDMQDHSKGVTFTALDITERKQAETGLLAERQYLTDIIDSLPDPTFIIDNDQRVVVWNRAAEAMTGVQRNDLIGKGDYAYAVPFYGEPRPILIDLVNISEKERERSYTNVKRIDDKIYAETFIQTLNDGEGVYLWGVAAPLYNQTGLRIGAIEVIKDITEIKKTEKSNIQLQEQLLQAQKIESIGRLAGGIAHDFNNMLGVILGHAELAQKQLDKTLPIFYNLEEIRKATQRSADITRQLLAFARKQTIAPQVIDLNVSVDGMLTMLRRLIGEDINLTWLPGKNLGLINIDPSQLDQVLANLFVNARDAIAGIGKVTIETNNVAFDEAYCRVHAEFAPGKYVMLAVSDNGCGMDVETMAHLFEPFFTTKEMGKGTGLGLATIYGIVKQNYGFINVYSELGQGTTFKIYLPRHEGNAALTPKVDTAGPVMPGNEVILLVEDEQMILGMTTTMLELQGYKVLPAATPGEAICLAQEHAGEIHLLMTDVIMPEMNGKDLAKTLFSVYPNLKLLFMSGYTANVIAHHGVLDEGVYFIQKPFSIKDLGAKLREALAG
jgi:two-component system, cell cycle sensor histidine kinase and response regulator CckA